MANSDEGSASRWMLSVWRRRNGSYKPWCSFVDDAVQVIESETGRSHEAGVGAMRRDVNGQFVLQVTTPRYIYLPLQGLPHGSGFSAKTLHLEGNSNGIRESNTKERKSQSLSLWYGQRGSGLILKVIQAMPEREKSRWPNLGRKMAVRCR